MKLDNKEDKFKYMYGGSSIEKKLMYTQILFIIIFYFFLSIVMFFYFNIFIGV